MEKIIDIISKLNGVIDLSIVVDEYKNKIVELENNYEKSGVVGLQNPGIRMVLRCDTVIAILKDSSFRPPSGATVFMVEEGAGAGAENKENKHLLTINKKNYMIIGEELINKKPSEDEEYMFISDDFILYPGRRKGRSENPAFFLIPPLGFQELESRSDLLEIKNIMSVSPSTMADDYIREKCNFSTRNDYATILIGFDKKT